MRPTIGITCSHDMGSDRLFIAQYYTRAVEAAGGMPILLPYVKDANCLSQLAHHLDGVVFSGGVDVDPQAFGEQPLPRLGEINPERDEFELALAKIALEADLAVLAICRGLQLLNIAAGGSIHQHLSNQIAPGLIKHSQDAPRWYATHKVSLKAGSILANLLQAREARVNSFHHQAVAQAAPGFIVNATSPEGVIEGLESENHKFVVGVQWHPECMWEKDPQMLKLFKGLVDASK